MIRKLATLFLTGALVFSLPGSRTFQAAAAGTAAQENYLEYSCPMHPEVKSRSPGTCPKCGMTLTAAASAPHTPADPASRLLQDHFPNVTLTTQYGKQVRLYDDLIKGKIVAVNLIYTQCKDLCPLETARLAQVQKMLGDRVGRDVFFYSISIDPEKDTPEALKAYAEKFHAGPGWLFLTGNKQDIQLVSKKLGLYSDPVNRDGHTPALLLGNEKTGQWMRDSATDNPRFLADLITNFLGGYQSRDLEPSHSYANAPTLSLTHKGQYLFATRCAACHTIGHGDKVGPDLLGVTNIRTREWLMSIIQTPDQMLDKKDPTAMALFNKYNRIQMPNLRLANEDVEYLLSYLESQTGSASQAHVESFTGAKNMKP